MSLNFIGATVVLSGIKYMPLCKYLGGFRFLINIIDNIWIVSESNLSV